MSDWIDLNTFETIDDISKMPKGVFGFVYMISTVEGKRYIGKKQVATKRKRRFGKKEIAKMTDKRRKTWEWVIKESDWKTYLSSNDKIKEDIKKGAKYKKFILAYAFNKKQLSYLEEKQLFVNEVLESDLYYNGNIAGRYFPKDVGKQLDD